MRDKRARAKHGRRRRRRCRCCRFAAVLPLPPQCRRNAPMIAASAALTSPSPWTTTTPTPTPTPQDVHRQLARGARMMALLALPLARASAESLTAVYARTFEKAAFGFAKMYLFCLFMRVLLSWFPGIDWNAQPWTFLRLVRCCRCRCWALLLAD